jgi:molecular chaperone IbpA
VAYIFIVIFELLPLEKTFLYHISINEEQTPQVGSCAWFVLSGKSLHYLYYLYCFMRRIGIMRNVDFTPLYRSAIGFDRLFNQMEKNVSNANTGYPPYNIEQQDDNRYRITMAVAGFAEEQLEITQQQNKLIVRGIRESEKEERQYLYQGIAERDFERKFQLADYVKVIDAQMVNGLLHIDLEREIPEEQQPRKIAINGRRIVDGE